MTYLIEIKLTPESKPLIDHLMSLRYVKVKREKAERRNIKAAQKPATGSNRKMKWSMVNKHLKSSKN